MAGRGYSVRGNMRQINSPFSMETTRRGRGRPKKFPLTGPLQVPDEQEKEAETSEHREEDVYFEQNYGEGSSSLKSINEQSLEANKKNINEDNKTKLKQQQKMTMVTPIGMRSRRTRSNQKRTEEKIDSGEEREGTSAASEQEQANYLVVDDKEEETKVMGKGARHRQASRKVLEAMVDAEEKSGNPWRTAAMTVAAQFLSENKEKEKHITVNEKIKTEEHIEPLLPNDAHIEEAEDVVQSIEKQVEIEKKEESTSRINSQKDDEKPTPKNDGSVPPPAPKNLINRANSRGRPANVIPPHRRPVPKDLLPPGVAQATNKRTVQFVKDHKLADNKDVFEKNEGLEKDHDEMVRREELKRRESAEIKSTLNEVKIGQSMRGMKKREAGQDLPYEHMPKQKARHVTKAGLVPNMPYDHIKTYEMGIDDQMLMQEHVIEEGESSGTQRVYSLQNGEYIEERNDMIEADNEKANMLLKPGAQYLHVEQDGIDIMYEIENREGEEEEEEDEGGQRGVVEGEEEAMGIADQVAQEEVGEQYVIESENEDIKQNQQVIEHVEVAEEIIEENQNLNQNPNIEDEDDDDELPPQLVAEEVQDDEIAAEVQRRHEEAEEKKNGSEVVDDAFDINMLEQGQTLRLSSPGGRSHEVTLTRDEQGQAVFVDENGVYVELITDNGNLVEPSSVIETELQQAEGQEQNVRNTERREERQPQGSRNTDNEQQNESTSGELRNIEFNFLDSRNICCGLCGEIVLYETLVSDHLPNAHPEFLQPGVELEEVPYENWLKSRLNQEMKTMQNGFRHFNEQGASEGGFGGAPRLFSRGIRHLRKVSQIRINPNEMTMDQLELALKRKMIEKLGRKVPVSLVDRLHARCDICQAVVSLNKKFEVIHLVRHFNAWHPAEHRCSGAWKQAATIEMTSRNELKTLSLHDFAVVDTESDQNNLQCIWCGMFMDRAAIGMHFSEVHADQVDVPKCSLCLQEMVVSARLMEKYGEDFGITLPDEFHVSSSRLLNKFSSEKTLDKAIEKYLKKLRTGHIEQAVEEAAAANDEEDEDHKTICTTNSQQSFGRRNRMKRKFVKPCFRQICPSNSEYFEAYSACEWKCKLCARNVYGAVISAGAIKHYKEFHPAEIEKMQYELVKARLERISDGSMEFVHPQLVECLICNLTYALHKPFNICRAIRHLRLKHAEVMPETAGKPISGAEIQETTAVPKSKKPLNIEVGEVITDPIKLERFRREHDDVFDKVQIIYGVKPNSEPSYILLRENEHMDQKMAEMVAEVMMNGEDENVFDSESRKANNTHPQIVFLNNETSAARQNQEYVEEQSTSNSNRRVVYRPREEEKPNIQKLVVEDNESFPQQIVEEEEEEGIVEEQERQEYIQEYDEQPERVIIDNDVVMDEGSFEYQLEGGNQYETIDNEQRITYMTEEELREAQAQGTIQLEYVEDDGGIEYEEYEEQVEQQ